MYIFHMTKGYQMFFTPSIVAEESLHSSLQFTVQEQVYKNSQCSMFSPAHGTARLSNLNHPGHIWGYFSFNLQVYDF